VNYWKSEYSSKRRKRRPPNKAYKLAALLNLQIREAMKMSRDALRKKVAESVSALREVQKRASELRQEWIERNAQDIAKAAGECDWRSHMEKMMKDEREREVNRKLTAIVKGSHQCLDWIEVPMQEW
jgi:hypothetical protein